MIPPEANTTEQNQTMEKKVQDPAMMICYRECLSNLEKFNGSEEQKVLQFINNIERIGRMIEANDNILHCMCIAKLDGEAKRWYEDNMVLNKWDQLKLALSERFTTSDSSSKIFEQLKERKQRTDESVTSYHDAVIKLCHEYDADMSQKMMISWVENGIKDSLRIPIKRQMKLLPEAARTTKAFLEIAKDEQELQEENSLTSESTLLHAPYFANTVSTTLQQTKGAHQNTQIRHDSPRRFTTSHSNELYQQQKNFHEQQRLLPNKHRTSTQHHSFVTRPQTEKIHHNTQYNQSKNVTPFKSPSNNKRRFNSCQICQGTNHHTMNCYYKKPNGCYNCGQSENRIRDCLQVFY